MTDIQARHELQRGILDALAPAIIALDDSGAVLYWNRTAESLFGEPSSSVRGKLFANLCSEANATRAVLERLLKLQSTTGELLVRSGDGAEVRMVVIAAPLRIDDALKGVVFQAEHVEERQRGESEQRLLAEVGAILSNSFESEAALERISRLLVPGMADMCMFYTEEVGGFVRPAAAAYDGEDLAALFEELQRARAEVGAPATVTHVMREGGSQMFAVTPEVLSSMARTKLERQLLSKTGFTSALTTALRARGRTIGALVLCRRGHTPFDQRDLRLAEEIARRAAVHVDNQSLYEAAVVANKSKSDFLAVISHELRTPLTTIMGYVELMASGVPERLPPKATAFLERVRTAAWHLLGLIEQILVYARLEAGRENLMPETVIMRQLVDEVRALMEPNALEKGITFVVDEMPPDLTVVTDLTKVRQILLNLASNAVKFTDDGEIHIGARAVGSDAQIYVRDTGIGIAEEHSERIFDAFWQVDQSATRRVGGAGLGLSVSRRLARLLGGDMTFSSAPGEGTEFVVRLPRAWRPREEHTDQL